MKSFELTVITYHYVRDVAGTEFPHLKALSVAAFDRQLDVLQKKYSIISWPVLADFLKNGALLPKNPCLLTFDDGTKDHYENIFPRLKERGLSGLFFVIVPQKSRSLRPVHIVQLLLAKFGYQAFRRMFEEKLSIGERDEFLRRIDEYIELHPEGKFGEVEPRAFRKVIQSTFLASAYPILNTYAAEYLPNIDANTFYLTPAEMNTMAQEGMFFGGHGKRHEYMTLLTEAEIRAEFSASRTFLEGIHEGPHAFNYPYGMYDTRVLKCVREGGFLAAFATDNQGPAQTDQFEIHRLDATLFPSLV